jgi:hypothetical protein
LERGEAGTTVAGSRHDFHLFRQALPPAGGSLDIANWIAGYALPRWLAKCCIECFKAAISRMVRDVPAGASKRCDGRTASKAGLKPPS